MRDPDKFDAIFLYSQPVDMRKSFSGLSHLVKSELGKTVFANTLFVFSNKSRTMIKALYWRKTGYVIWGYRLEKNKFKWLTACDGEELTITADQFRMLLDGCDLSAMKPHSPLEFSVAY